MKSTTLANLVLSERLCKTLLLPALHSDSDEVRRRGVGLLRAAVRQVAKGMEAVKFEVSE